MRQMAVLLQSILGTTAGLKRVAKQKTTKRGGSAEIFAQKLKWPAPNVKAGAEEHAGGARCNFFKQTYVP